MRNKIPCTAERLGLLNPQMIQAVSEVSSFQFAQQYLTENRVRIVEAGDVQITSAVIGNAGLYEQCIILKDGHLLSKCSCTLSEEPMCRHCIGVLLEYHRWSQPKPSQNAVPSEESKSPTRAASCVSRKATASEPSVADVKLSEVIQFMEWLPSAARAIQAQVPLPTPPQFDSAEVSTWIHTIRTLAESRREGDQAATRLRAEMRDRELHVQRLTQDLHISMDEAKAGQATADEMRLKIATYEKKLAKAVELASEIVRYEEQMRLVAGDLLQNGSEFDKLASSVKKIAQTLKITAKSTLQES